MHVSMKVNIFFLIQCRKKRNLLSAADSIIPKATVGWQQHVWPNSCIQVVFESGFACVPYKYVKSLKQQSCCFQKLFLLNCLCVRAVRVWTWSFQELESAPERLVLHLALVWMFSVSSDADGNIYWPGSLFFFLFSRQQVIVACRSPLLIHWLLFPPQTQFLHCSTRVPASHSSQIQFALTQACVIKPGCSTWKNRNNNDVHIQMSYLQIMFVHVACCLMETRSHSVRIPLR